MSFDIPKLRENLIKAMDKLLLKKDEKLNDDVLKEFLKAVYEYCRHCHIIEKKIIMSEDFEAELLKNKFQVIFRHFDQGLWNLILSLKEQDIFDYCRYRSAVQFLFDDFVENIPDLEMENNLSSVMSNFEPREYFLSYNYDDNFSDPYPAGPVPEHAGVPNTHWWWEKVVNIYE